MRAQEESEAEEGRGGERKSPRNSRGSSAARQQRLRQRLEEGGGETPLFSPASRALLRPLPPASSPGDVACRKVPRIDSARPPSRRAEASSGGVASHLGDAKKELKGPGGARTGGLSTIPLGARNLAQSVQPSEFPGKAREAGVCGGEGGWGRSGISRGGISGWELNQAHGLEGIGARLGSVFPLVGALQNPRSKISLLPRLGFNIPRVFNLPFSKTRGREFVVQS